jgi:hypothetical protein
VGTVSSPLFIKGFEIRDGAKIRDAWANEVRD